MTDGSLIESQHTFWPLKATVKLIGSVATSLNMKKTENEGLEATKYNPVELNTKKYKKVNHVSSL